MSEDEAIEILNTFKLRQRTKKYNKLSLEDVKATEKVLNELENKDKIIDAMALQLFGVLIRDDKKEELITLDTEEEVKQHFERKVKDE